MKRIVVSMSACLTVALFVSNLQAQQLKTLCLGSINRFEKTENALSYDRLMLLCTTDLYRNQTDQSRIAYRSCYYLFSADSLQIYYGILSDKDKGYDQYLPQKQKGKTFSFRRGDVAQYVLEELDKGNVVSVACLNKRKFIVQSFNN